MSERILALFAFAMLLGFLGILLWNVPRADLAVVIGLTVLLAGWDFFLRRRGN